MTAQIEFEGQIIQSESEDGLITSQRNSGLFAGTTLLNVLVRTPSIEPFYFVSPSKSAIQGYAADEGTGVAGIADMGYGLRGRSDTNYGLYAESRLFSGAYFRGEKGNGFADIVLGASPLIDAANDDDGTIMSDPDAVGSDLFFVANDAVVAKIDRNNNGSGNFYVQDGNGTNLLQVTKSGETMVRTHLTIDPITGDDAIVRSNPGDIGGDIFLESNDAVVARIDKNNNGQGNFFVFDGDNNQLFQVDINGNVKVNGSTVHSSDRNRKEAIVEVSNNDILNAIVAMPIYEWQYKEEDRRHIGPMAQDFHKAFGLGDDDKTIAAIDADGVALAAIQAQQVMIAQQTEQLTLQRKQIEFLMNKMSLLASEVQGLKSASKSKQEDSFRKE